MKKSLIIIILLLTILISGCEKKSGELTCTSTTNPNETITLDSKYVVTYKDGYVTKLKTTETIEAKEVSDLETYKEALELAYSDYNNIDYYSNTITIEDNKLVSSTVIDYEKVDTDKLIEIDSNNGTLIKDGKISLQDIKDMYTGNGCTCK